MLIQDPANQVIKHAAALCGNEAQAVTWFNEQRVPELGGRTPAELVVEGRAQQVLQYLEMLDAGPLG